MTKSPISSATEKPQDGWADSQVQDQGSKDANKQAKKQTRKRKRKRLADIKANGQANVSESLTPPRSTSLPIHETIAERSDTSGHVSHSSQAFLREQMETKDKLMKQQRPTRMAPILAIARDIADVSGVTSTVGTQNPIVDRYDAAQPSVTPNQHKKSRELMESAPAGGHKPVLLGPGRLRLEKDCNIYMGDSDGKEVAYAPHQRLQYDPCVTRVHIDRNVIKDEPFESGILKEVQIMGSASRPEDATNTARDHRRLTSISSSTPRHTTPHCDSRNSCAKFRSKQSPPTETMQSHQILSKKPAMPSCKKPSTPCLKAAMTNPDSSSAEASISLSSRAATPHHKALQALRRPSARPRFVGNKPQTPAISQSLLSPTLKHSMTHGKSLYMDEATSNSKDAAMISKSKRKRSQRELSEMSSASLDIVDDDCDSGILIPIPPNPQRIFGISRNSRVAKGQTTSFRDAALSTSSSAITPEPPEPYSPVLANRFEMMPTTYPLARSLEPATSSSEEPHYTESLMATSPPHAPGCSSSIKDKSQQKNSTSAIPARLLIEWALSPAELLKPAKLKQTRKSNLPSLANDRDTAAYKHCRSGLITSACPGTAGLSYKSEKSGWPGMGVLSPLEYQRDSGSRNYATAETGFVHQSLGSSGMISPSHTSLIFSARRDIADHSSFHDESPIHSESLPQMSVLSEVSSWQTEMARRTATYDSPSTSQSTDLTSRSSVRSLRKPRDDFLSTSDSTADLSPLALEVYCKHRKQGFQCEVDIRKFDPTWVELDRNSYESMKADAGIPDMIPIIVYGVHRRGSGRPLKLFIGHDMAFDVGTVSMLGTAMKQRTAASDTSGLLPKDAHQDVGREAREDSLSPEGGNDWNDGTCDVEDEDGIGELEIDDPEPYLPGDEPYTDDTRGGDSGRLLDDETEMDDCMSRSDFERESVLSQSSRPTGMTALRGAPSANIVPLRDEAGGTCNRRRRNGGSGRKNNYTSIDNTEIVRHADGSVVQYPTRMAVAKTLAEAEGRVIEPQSPNPYTGDERLDTELDSAFGKSGPPRQEPRTFPTQAYSLMGYKIGSNWVPTSPGRRPPVKKRKKKTTGAGAGTGTFKSRPVVIRG